MPTRMVLVRVWIKIRTSQWCTPFFELVWSAFDHYRLNTNDLSIALDMICAIVEARANLNAIDRGLARNIACADDCMCLRACSHRCTFACDHILECRYCFRDTAIHFVRLFLDRFEATYSGSLLQTNGYGEATVYMVLCKRMCWMERSPSETICSRNQT